ncbi:hypothetical protein Tco_0483101, partial [Tanacetum coccineum]
SPRWSVSTATKWDTPQGSAKELGTSYMADDEVPTNMALMAISDSEVNNEKTCSKTCLKRFETLKGAFGMGIWEWGYGFHSD